MGILIRLVLWMMETNSGKTMDSKQTAAELFDWQNMSENDLSRRLEGVKVSISSNTVNWLKGFCEHSSQLNNSIDGYVT